MPYNPIAITGPATQPLGGQPATTSDALRKMQFAQALLQGGPGGPGAGTRYGALAQGIRAWAGALLAAKANREQKARETAYNETLSRAVGAAEPWRPPEDVYRQRDLMPGSGEAAVPQPVPGAQPVVKAGQPAPGTGGLEAVQSVLGQNPDTAPIAARLTFQDLLRQRAAEAEQAKAAAAENLFLRGRGSPDYLGRVAGAQALGKGTYVPLSLEEKRAAGLDPTKGYQRNMVTGQVSPVDKSGQTINLGDKASEAHIKVKAAVTTQRLKQFAVLADQHRDLVPRLQAISTALEGGAVNTGAFEDLVFGLRQYANSLGIWVDPNLSNEEQVRSFMRYMAPRMRVVGSGATSDFEMREFRAAAPTYSNTTNGNILLARSMLQIHDYNNRANDLANRYYDEHDNLIGVDDYIGKQLGPVFPQVNTDDAATKLPPGTVFFNKARKSFGVVAGGQ